ncbi:alpha/beta fold hydrolase [Nocardioides cynanchi]|uniref:alpha/beta fold hydrolase n=1 Tax=Nocardioides cynanchi TaxID=2558918 RepID=UPI0012482E14|nr:alpha/beta hydrolase [Nocardioides cynanchi]
MTTIETRGDHHAVGHPGTRQPIAQQGPFARLIALSLAIGVAVAGLLTLVVFPGGSESTITGSLLVGFGAGWALMAWLTSRFTTPPLRWAAFPAAAMGLTGAALLVFTPGDSAMAAMSWVWPVPTVVLSVYIWTQVRRSLPRRGRWMLTPVAALLAVASIGAVYEDVSVVRDHRVYSGPGTTYEVNGHRLYLDCRGHGSPTVVLSNGLGEVAASWTRIVVQVDADTRVCAYDRAGQGWSGDVSQPQDGVTAARDLHTLLREAGEHGPYVLVGHSIGGSYVMTYAAKYPGQVAGMVLLDSSSPHQFTVLPAYATQYALMMRRGLAFLPTLDRIGLGRLLADVMPSHFPQPAADVVTSLTASARGARNGRDEISILPTLFSQAGVLTSLHGRPLAVLTSTDNLRKTAGWGEAQDQLAALSTNVVHRVVDSTHPGLLEDQSPARASARAIDQVIAAVRGGTRVSD